MCHPPSPLFSSPPQLLTALQPLQSQPPQPQRAAQFSSWGISMLGLRIGQTLMIKWLVR